MKKLWQKQWTLNETIEAFETKDDLVLDDELVIADVAGSLAHARGLVRIGFLTPQEFARAEKGLLNIVKLHNKGKFPLAAGDEDVHTKIETYLTDTCGSVGKKIHTGRSRNDQVLTALRLRGKQDLLTIWQRSLELAQEFLKFAKTYEFMAMPGYTHMQKAMPASLGMWAGAFVESLLDDQKTLQRAIEILDQSPLGSAAGYGVPMALDREFTAKLLGFAGVQNNSLYCQNGRGKIEAVVVAALVSLFQTLNKFATDVLLFTTREFGYFTVADEMVTGSSIMPQKKNIDIAELLRSKLHVMLNYYSTIVGISSNLPLGYNRDLQDTKRPFLESLRLAKDSLTVARILVSNIAPNARSLTAAMSPEIFATHAAIARVKNGLSFRDAYRQVGAKQNDRAPTASVLAQSTHIGGTGNLGLARLADHLTRETVTYRKAQTQFRKTFKRLGMGQEDEL